MLHQINLPGYATSLNGFVHFQQQLLEFACTPTLSDPLEPDKVKDVFKGESGIWLCSKLWNRNGQPKEFCGHLRKLTDFIKCHPAQRNSILTAFAHDIDFYSHLADPTFQFSYCTLNKNVQVAVKPLMAAFYELLSEGFPSFGQGALQRLSRRDVATMFWHENHTLLKVCPSCDGQAPRFVNGRAYANMDHFFPKSRYPFLSIHPYNLVPICTDCNQYFKRDIDPIADHQRETLIDIFHPYGRPAVQYLDVQTKRGPHGEYIVHLYDREQSGVSRRIKNLDRIFRLIHLWKDDYLPYVVSKITDDLRDIGSYRRDRGEPLDKHLVTEVLQLILQNYAYKVGKQERYILMNSYALYALSHQDEFDRLVEVLMN